MGFFADTVAKREAIYEEQEKNRINEQDILEAQRFAQSVNHQFGFFKNNDTAYVKLGDLVPFENQPYRRLPEDKLKQLAESIQANGLLNPIIFRKKEGVGYQILSGNNRYYAMHDILQWEPSTKVFCKYVEVENEDEAVKILIDANESQRENISPSERAAAIALRYQTIRDTFGEEKNGRRSKKIVAEEFGISESQVQRYININTLSDDWKEMIDKGKIAVEAAVEISLWKKPDQEVMYEYMQDKKLKISDIMKIGVTAKDSGNTFPLSKTLIDSILNGTNKEKRFRVPPKYRKLVPENLAPTPTDCDRFIQEAIAEYIAKKTAEKAAN